MKNLTTNQHKPTRTIGNVGVKVRERTEGSSLYVVRGKEFLFFLKVGVTYGIPNPFSLYLLLTTLLLNVLRGNVCGGLVFSWFSCL
jgi:hypothetical protein